MKRKPSGFTIVELLIVIVIIGILAALVITVYNGIQQRARNTARIASAKELQKLVNAYIIQEGKYPPINVRGCLGTGYTDWNGDGSLDCFDENSANANPTHYHPSTALNNELQKIAPPPSVETSDVKGTNDIRYRGYVYFPGHTIDGQAGRAMFDYFLEGTNQNCVLPGVLSYNSTTGTFVTSSAISYSSNHAGNTYCRVAFAEL